MSVPTTPPRQYNPPQIRSADQMREDGGVLRGLSGAFTAGLVVVAVIVSGAQYLGAQRGFPGPGAVSVAAHIAAAIAAVVVQHFADHRRRGTSVAASLLVFVIAGVLLWTQWWG